VVAKQPLSSPWWGTFPGSPGGPVWLFVGKVTAWHPLGVSQT